MSKKQKIAKQKQLIQELCLLNINLAIMVGLGKSEQPQFEQASTPKSEPKQPETAKDNPTMDGAKLDFKQVDFFRLARDFSKSSMGMLISMIERRDKTKCAGCRNIEPFKSDDDSKYMSDFEVALRYVKWGINESKQPETQPKQGSDGEDSPIFGKCRGGFTNRKFPQYDADQLDAKLRELDKLPLKSEAKEAVQPKENQGEIEQPQWWIYNKKNNSLVLIADGENCRYSSRQDAENAICRLHNSGHISGKFHHYEAVLVIEMIKRMEAKEAQSDQRKTENDSKKQGEKQQFWIVQTNPMKLERFNSYYLNTVNNDGLVQHTPDPNEAMRFVDTGAAYTEIDKIIAYGAGRYELADFKIVKKP